MGEREMGLMQNHDFSDESGPNLTDLFFITQKEILAWFYIKKQTPGTKIGEGGCVDAKSCFFLCNAFVRVELNIPLETFTFHSPCQNYGVVSYR